MSRFRMHLKFDAIYKEASRTENMVAFSPEEDRIVLFSDHHKGAGSKADDFKKNAALYESALSHYDKLGYKLILIGDSEELWETRIDHILKRYRAIISQEIRMSPEGEDGKKLRVWGNHDKEVILKRFARSLRLIEEDLLSLIHI